jgi:hypothetical protein
MIIAKAAYRFVERRYVLGLLIGVALVAAGVVYAVNRREPKSSPPAPVLAVSDTFSLLASLAISDETQLATDGDAPLDNEPLWVFSGDRESPTVYRVSFGDQTLVTSRMGRVQLATSRNAVLDVARWGKRGIETLFAIENVAEGVTMDRYPLAEPFEQVAHTTVAVEPRPPLARREFALATWSGDLPDLVVVDVGTARDRVQVRVFSGETDFQEMVFEDKATFLGGQDFALDVGRVTEPLPDLIFAKSGEVHVLKGETAFHEFFLQRRLALARASGPAYRFALGSSFGVPALYALDSRRRDRPGLDVISLYQN